MAFADSLPFPGNSFDIVVSRFGVMFFASPVDSFREWLRILKPGGRDRRGRLAFCREKPVPLCRRVKFLQILASCRPFCRSWCRCDIRTYVAVLDTSIDFDRAFWTLRFEMSETLRTKIAGLSKEQIAALKREVIEALTAYASDRGISFRAEVLIVRGQQTLSSLNYAESNGN